MYYGIIRFAFILSLIEAGTIKIIKDASKKN